MNILIPQNLLFGGGYPACLAHTWLQLRSLAGEAGRTPPVSPAELRRLTGKSLPTLYRHLRRLKQAGLLDWRCPGGNLQVSFGAGEADQQAVIDGQEPVDKRAAEFSISSDSQNCNCASLNPLTDSIFNLTRVEAGFSKSRTHTKSSRASKTRKGVKPDKTSENSQAGQAKTAIREEDAAGIYRLVARLTPNPAQRDLLLRQVGDLPRWRGTLEHWLAHRWNPRNLPGMLDLYRRGSAAACRYCPQAQAPKSAEAFQQLRAQYNTLQAPAPPSAVLPAQLPAERPAEPPAEPTASTGQAAPDGAG